MLRVFISIRTLVFMIPLSSYQQLVDPGKFILMIFGFDSTVEVVL